jgi:hypothetical protein
VKGRRLRPLRAVAPDPALTRVELTARLYRTRLALHQLLGFPAFWTADRPSCRTGKKPRLALVLRVGENVTSPPIIPPSSAQINGNPNQLSAARIPATWPA